MSNWLLDRLFDAGNQAEPRFAFQGTVNWMRALSTIINNGACDSDELKSIYQKVQRRSVNREADTLVFENMHMAYHNLASLKAMNNDALDKYDICRSAIVSWYYSIYFAASAMVAASSGSTQETHALTSKVWQADIVEKKLIPYPFSLYLSSLVTSKAEEEIAVYRGDNNYNLNDYANDTEMAHGAIVSYLKGTHGYKKWEAEEKIKSSKEFKALNVENFRKKVTQELRDRTLDKGQVNFLIQAFRYRGKANYRDSIFLSYGDNNQNTIENFINDLNIVSAGFIRAASHYCSVRVEKGTWELFIDDIKNNTRLSLDVEAITV
ncbi:hypothetical protein IPZ60_13435 [Psychrobacter sp. NG25]|uniref:hypothetical protein n=1 Tax=Psychrobacter sp. NG25 TaxID=2782005 RepID=UPI001883C25F|nr:hypothetical protein [Psychrobacter sp. NG25]MBF0659747.1 hypothetical protein [Psychrobacter sp. NG25]